MKDRTVAVRLRGEILESLEQARGDMDLSNFLAKMIEQQMSGGAAEREAWLSEGRKQYTPEVCKQTLELNEEFPIHDE